MFPDLHSNIVISACGTSDGTPFDCIGHNVDRTDAIQPTRKQQSSEFVVLVDFKISALNVLLDPLREQAAEEREQMRGL